MLYNHIYGCDFAIVQDERRGAVHANKRPWKPQESLSLQVTKVLYSVSDDKSALILSLLIIIITEKSVKPCNCILVCRETISFGSLQAIDKMLSKR